MNFNLILYEDKSWILKDFLNHIKNGLLNKGYLVSESKRIDSKASVNIHFAHSMIDMGEIRRANTTLHLVMVTHLSGLSQLKKLIYLSEVEHVKFFAMSKWMCSKLKKILYNEQNINYIMPPCNTNSVIIGSKSVIKIGIFSNYYEDGRKNEDFLYEALIRTDVEFTEINFIIYGSNWELIFNSEKIEQYKMKNIFFTLVDEKVFNYITYKNVLDEIDYYLYMGHDEGSMSFLDAVFFNKKIIAIPQGFQNDLKNFIQFPIYNSNDLRNVFVKLCDELKLLNLFKENNSWINYVDKIVEFANSKRNANRIIKEFKYIKKIRYILLKKYYVKQFKQSQPSKLSCVSLNRRLLSSFSS
jgi:hypothetical protein